MALSAQPQLWVTSLALAHAFAAWWLARALLLLQPGVWRKLVAWAGLGERHGQQAAPPAAQQDVTDASGSSFSSCLSDPGPVDGLVIAMTGAGRRRTKPPAAGPQQQRHDHDQLEQDEAGRHQTGQLPLRLEWSGVCCSYSTAAGRKAVLDDVCGVARAGELQALMGPSGAGKSTLMDILCSRKTTGQLAGLVLLNGEPVGDNAYGRRNMMSSYVPQDDNFVPTMTVLETLSFSAALLHRPTEHSRAAAPRGSSAGGSGRAAQLQHMVAGVLELLGLTQQADTLVGGHLPGGLMLRGLSGGERKRLSLAAGLLGDPALLFLDEITSGLDSAAALGMVQHLQRVAGQQGGKLVVMCLHQPRASIWALCDVVTLLARGRLIYHGPTRGLLPWFTDVLACSYDPAAQGLVIDWALDLVTLSAALVADESPLRTEQDLLRASQLFLRSYRSLQQEQQQEQQQQRRRRQQPGPAPLPPPAAAPGRAARLWRAYKALTWRELLSITRNPADVAGRTCTFCWVAVLVGLIYYDLPTGAGSIRSRVNLLYSALSFFLLMPIISMGLYTQDRRFYVRDTAARMYTPLPYYLAKVTAVTPFNIITALACDLPLYGLTGLRHGAGAVARHATISSALLLVAQQVLHLAASVAPNQDLAFMATIAWTCLNLLLAGFFITFKEMAFSALTSLRYVSAMHFAFEGVLQVELSGRAFECSSGDGADGWLRSLQDLLPAPVGAGGSGPGAPRGNSTASSAVGSGALAARPQPQLVELWLLQQQQQAAGGAGCVVDGGRVVSAFGFGRGFGSTVGCLLGYWAALHAATYVALVLLAKRERR